MLDGVSGGLGGLGGLGVSGGLRENFDLTSKLTDVSDMQGYLKEDKLTVISPTKIFRKLTLLVAVTIDKNSPSTALRALLPNINFISGRNVVSRRSKRLKLVRLFEQILVESLGGLWGLSTTKLSSLQVSPNYRTPPARHSLCILFN